MFGISLIPLPYKILAGVLGVAAIAGGGFGYGVHVSSGKAEAANSACEAAKADSRSVAAAAWVAEIKAAAGTALQIGTALASWAEADRQHVIAAQHRTTEVNHAFDAAPDLSHVAVPADVLRVRAEQVRESADVAARTRKGIGVGPGDTGAPAGRHGQ